MTWISDLKDIVGVLGGLVGMLGGIAGLTTWASARRERQRDREHEQQRQGDELLKERIFLELSSQSRGNARKPVPGSHEARLYEEMVRDGRLRREAGGMYMLNHHSSVGSLYSGRGTY